MLRSEVYETIIIDPAVKESLTSCETTRPLSVVINYELYKLVDIDVKNNYDSRRTFIERAIIKQLKADGIIE